MSPRIHEASARVAALDDVEREVRRLSYDGDPFSADVADAVIGDVLAIIRRLRAASTERAARMAARS